MTLCRGLVACALAGLLALPAAPPAAHAVAPLAAIAVTGQDGRVGAPVPITVTNPSGYTIAVRRALRVERWTGNGWAPLAPPAEDLLLRADCQPDARTRVVTPDALRDGCVTIGPRATFRGQPWLGTSGHAQCACERCAKVAPGTYRYAAQLCPGSRGTLAVHGLPFRLR